MDQKKHRYRIAADDIWEMSNQYMLDGYVDIASVLREISTNLHFLGSVKQKEESSNKG